MTISEVELKRRMHLTNPEEFASLNESKRSCLIIMSHCGNWEWVCDAADCSVEQHAQCVYKTLSNKNWEAWFLKVRSRFGTEPFPMEKTLRVMTQNASMVTATAFIGDQNPANGRNAYWTTFLNQDTCFMSGAEKIARKMDHAVYYLTMKKVKRGFYTAAIHLLENNPKSTSDGEITEKIVRATENDIKNQPENWLWSHRRWKHKREQ
jgi:Kdo2-lipid IVA lauroyltransferase/acyltransferase